MRTPVPACVVAVAAVLLGSCGGGGASPTSTTPSTPSRSSSSSTSHNAGRDCLACHGFSAAGSVYRADGTTPRSGATVRLTTAPNGGGDTVATLVSDGSGNFYTPTAIAFGSGLYAEISVAGAGRITKQAAVKNGGCNSCHGAGNRLRVD